MAPSTYGARGGGYGERDRGSFGGGRGAGASFRGDPAGPPDSDDEALRREGVSMEEFRRRKRIRLGEKQRMLVWRVTPSPDHW